MADVDNTDKILARLDALEQENARLKARLPEPVEAPVAGGEYPRVVYRHHGKGTAAVEAGKPLVQIDHPDHDAKVVASALELEAALAEGWTLLPDSPKAKAKK